MADQASAAAAADALRRFHASNSSSGRFLRYCRGRIGAARLRLGFSLIAALAFTLLHEPVLGLLVAATLILGEMVEFVSLRNILARVDEVDRIPIGDRRLALSAASVHALSVALSAGFIWALGDEGETQFLAITLLIAATMDAGATLPVHRRAAIIRLVTYAVTFTALEVYEFSHHPLIESATGRHGFDMVASLMLAFIAGAFIHQNFHFYNRRKLDARTIFEEQQRLLLSQEALGAKEREARRLALVAQNANDAVIIYSAAGVVGWVNDTFTKITGYEAEEMVGRRIEDVVHAQDLWTDGVAALIEARRTMSACRAEIRMRRKTGEVIWVETNLTPTIGGDGLEPMMIAVERDITEAKAREADLARAREEAEAGAKAKASFLATMSHEIRTPLNGVIGTAELLCDTQMNEEQRLYVETIVDSGRSLMTIINDILDLSRLQSGAPILKIEPIDLTDCFGRAISLLQATAGAKDISLTFITLSGGGPVVMGDGGRLRQILLNLLGNAIKFTACGSVTVALTARPVGERQEVELTVSDTGVGIPEDRLEAVFESFTQADGETSRRFGGTGLGLTISRMLAKEMGGEITARSEPGKGSVFTLRLSLANAQMGALDVGDKLVVDGEGVSFAPMALDILVADDNRTNVLIVERMLIPEGHSVRRAADGAEVVAAYVLAPPDLVLMDLSMPEMDGFAALREIRMIEAHRGERRPIIALTANGFEEDRAACFEAGFDGFATKPVNKRVLLAEIARCLAETAPLRGEFATANTQEKVANLTTEPPGEAGAKPKRRRIGL